MVDSHGTHNMYPNLSETLLSMAQLNIPLNDQEHFRLNKIKEIKDYFIVEIKERELMSKWFSKYIASFDYFNKSLIVLSVTTGSISIASFATVIGSFVGITSASFSLAFLICPRIVKELLKTTRNNKKKHYKIVMLPRSTLNSTESKISEALINTKIIYEDFVTIINEEKKIQRTKGEHWNDE